MQHISFSETGNFTFAVLIKEQALRSEPIKTHYLEPLKALGYEPETVAFSLTYDKKKPSASCIYTYLDQLLPAIDRLNIRTILCCDAEYFKKLAKVTKAPPEIGYVKPVKLKGYEHLNVIYAPTYTQYFHNPLMAEKTHLSLVAAANHSKGTYVALGSNLFKSVSYPKTVEDIDDAINKLYLHEALTADIEAFSLKHYDAGIGTISFAWDDANAVAFPVDYVACDPYEIDVWDNKDKKFKKKTAYGKIKANKPVRKLLKKFFENYAGNLKWHNISYDAYVLIYQLWMDDLLDQEGMLTGIEFMTKNFDCTKLITYLATNSCAGNKLGLKEQAHEFAGNYAEDEIKNILLMPLDQLLEYNAVDTVSTWYTYNKNYPKMVEDEQLDIYLNIFKECVPDILQMQLTGMCLDMDEVHVANDKISGIRDTAVTELLATQTVQKFIHHEIAEEVKTRNANYKQKVIGTKDAKFKFNPNSNPQLQRLLFGLMDLPVIDLTDKKQPATGGKTLEKLINHTDNNEYKLILQALIDFALADKILSSFISKFLEAPLAPDGMHYVYGSFNLGGTVSGRLSASGGLNLQTIPSGSHFAKVIKRCFVAPPNMIFCGSDFNALEDVVNTLLTKDPNKEKVLTDGYDGHSYRAYYYWRDQFPDIDPNIPESINTIKKVAEAVRSASKPVSFALQYQGTWATLVANCGFSEEEAKQIEANYHDLYVVSMEWLQDRLQEASKVGYGVGAFGLRIRAPVLHQVIFGNSKTPQEAQAEGRTLGNALSGQSYGLLNGRASMEFMKRVRSSIYRTKIRLCAHIHDAIYLYVEDCFGIIKWVNDNLIECMAWNELPELQHPEIKLGSELDIFYPSWAQPITLNNHASKEEIIQTCREAYQERKVA